MRVVPVIKVSLWPYKMLPITQIMMIHHENVSTVYLDQTFTHKKILPPEEKIGRHVVYGTKNVPLSDGEKCPIDF